MRMTAVALLAGALLAGCGQKGALYLPGQQREPVGTTTPTSTPATPVSSPIPPAAGSGQPANTRRNSN